MQISQHGWNQIMWETENFIVIELYFCIMYTKNSNNCNNTDRSKPSVLTQLTAERKKAISALGIIKKWLKIKLSILQCIYTNLVRLYVRYCTILITTFLNRYNRFIERVTKINWELKWHPYKNKLQCLVLLGLEER